MDKNQPINYKKNARETVHFFCNPKPNPTYKPTSYSYWE